MDMLTPTGTLAREARLDRRIDDLISKLATAGWSAEETAEYHQLVGAKTSTLRNRSRIMRRRTAA